MKFSLISIVLTVPAVVSAGYYYVHNIPSNLAWMRIDKFDSADWWISCAGKRMLKRDLVYEAGQDLHFAKRTEYGLMFATHRLEHIQAKPNAKIPTLIVDLEFVIPIPQNHLQAVPIYLSGASYIDLDGDESKSIKCEHGLL